MNEFAALLKTQREAAGLTLEDLFQRTRINRVFLEAIEEGRFDVLPSVYVRLFLKKYAQEVGLDVQQTLRNYEISTQPPANPIKSRHLESSAMVPILAALGVLVVIISIGFWTLNDSEAPQIPQDTRPDKGTTRLQPQPAPSSPQAPTAAESSDRLADTPIESEDGVPQEDVSALVEPARGDRVVSAYSLSLGFPINRKDSILVLSAIATGATRVSVRSDEQAVFEGLLTVGSQRTWEARTRIRVEIEKAGALALSLQGNPLKRLGKPGRKLRLFISRASIWVEEIEPAGPAATP
jgi:cytoskeletal protein RodZ